MMAPPVPIDCRPLFRDDVAPFGVMGPVPPLAAIGCLLLRVKEGLGAGGEGIDAEGAGDFAAQTWRGDVSQGNRTKPWDRRLNCADDMGARDRRRPDLAAAG
jgi:hypothetical protein